MAMACCNGLGLEVLTSPGCQQHSCKVHDLDNMISMKTLLIAVLASVAQLRPRKTYHLAIADQAIANNFCLPPDTL